MRLFIKRVNLCIWTHEKDFVNKLKRSAKWETEDEKEERQKERVQWMTRMAKNKMNISA